MDKIKILVMDVDGTLTDGGIYMGERGEIMKRFDIKDGYAIHDLLPKLGITPVVITGRESKIVKNRCVELGITNVIQNCNDKVNALKQVLSMMNLGMDNVAYMGDDINDLECMKRVGMCACPGDAVDEIKRVCDYVCTRKGGAGAVREFVGWLSSQ